MKRALFFIVAVFLSSTSYCQHNLIDSLQRALRNEKTDTGKAIILYNLSGIYKGYKSDSALILGQEAYSISVKHNFLWGERWSLNAMAGAFRGLGDYSKALEYYIQQLKINEQLNYPDDIANVDMNIALVYNSEKDPDKALSYALKADSIIKQNNLETFRRYSLLNLGDIYEKANKLPLALSSTLECYSKSVQANDSIITGTALNNLGNIYSKMDNVEQAVASYKASVPYLTALNDNNNLSECELGLARVFDRKNITDSARNYAVTAYNLSLKNGFLNHAFDASIFLYQLYKKEHKIDSAFAYHEIMYSLKDSIQSIEKVKQLTSITIEEQLRQKQIAEQLEQDKKDLHEKLQLLFIGIMIPAFFLISIYLSRKKVHSKIIEFSGIVSLLLLFEYITLLIHPFVAEKTNHSPFLEIIILVVIAALITPVHHRLERWLMTKLTKMQEKQKHKNKLSPIEAAEEENTPETPD